MYKLPNDSTLNISPLLFYNLYYVKYNIINNTITLIISELPHNKTV